MIVPETKYAKIDDVHIAYQIFGSGSIPVVVAPGWTSHIEYAWEEPSYAHFLERLGSFARVAWFDKHAQHVTSRQILAQLGLGEVSHRKPSTAKDARDAESHVFTNKLILDLGVRLRRLIVMK